MKDLSKKIENERLHANVIIETNESSWGWSTFAGQIRKQRRLDFLSLIDSDLQNELKVLEVGCGTGTFSKGLSQKFKNLICIDISEILLEKARTLYSGICFLNMDIHKTTFPSEYFDLIVGCSVLHHLDWQLALKEIYRILKPGGQIRFSEPNLLNPQIFLVKNIPWLKKKMGDSPDEYAFTARKIRRVLNNCGFCDIKVTSYEFLHPHTPKFLIKLVLKIESFVEKSILKEFAGSLKISASKPSLK